MDPVPLCIDGQIPKSKDKVDSKIKLIRVCFRPADNGH